ncbi:MAG: AEC family transporter, partial [Clostridia bacterium]|nr:AEC family transporter [Clostridia bacterium]
PVFMLSIKVPDIILTPVSAISGMNSPLAMLMFGTYISNTDFRTVFRDKKIPFVALFKLILMPLAMLAALKLFGIGGALGTTLLIASATPSANNTIMFAAKYERDTSLASQTVAIVSLLSIITLPIMIALY